MDEANETLWRSIDSSSDLADSFSEEVSFKSLTGCSDSSAFNSMMGTPQKSEIIGEEGLLAALRNLQIASTKKPLFRPPSVSTNDHQESIYKIDDKILEKLITEEIEMVNDLNVSNNFENLEIVDKKTQSMTLESSTVRSETKQTLDVPSSEDSDPRNDCKEDLKIIGQTIINDSSQKIELIDSNVLNNMEKAVGSISKASATRKTIGRLPTLQNRSRSRVIKVPPMNQSNKLLTNNNKIKLTDKDEKKTSSQSSSRSSSTMRQSVKNIVATVVTTKDGIKLKEEKINNFGIPISNLKKKKRTEAIPFSFSVRDKNLQQLEVKKKPMKELNLKNHEKQEFKKIDTKKSQNIKIQINDKISMKFNDKSIDKENTMINLNKKTFNNFPPKLYTEKRLKERREFDDKIKQREKEIEIMKIKYEKKKMDNEKMMNFELRTKMVSKANPVPNFKIPNVIKSKKSLTEPQTPGLAFKMKK